MYELIVMCGVFLAAFVVGYFLISRVPSLLHTPLMSMTNAISAVTVIGAMLIFAEAPEALAEMLGAVAIAMAMFNVVGGFAVTDRMTRLFKSNPKQ
jgi:NAD(P) transhydrogenase subunit alpha